jgi:glycosyltransferase involved in cell wall biosynthesis
MILDDGSTDGTAELAEQLSGGEDWIEVHRLEPRRERSFGAQYRAIMRGYDKIRSEPFEFVGALDADISFESNNYFSCLIEEFRRHPRLGMAGGVVYEKQKGVFKERKGNSERSVAGAVQMFRREVFDEIGGYIPLEHGAADTLAMLMVRMKAWEVRPVPELRVLHHRPSSSAEGLLRGAFKNGVVDAAFGYHPLFALLKYARRLTFKPYVLKSLLLLAGYCSYWLKGGKPVIPREVLEYLRRVQLARSWRAIVFKDKF